MQQTTIWHTMRVVALALAVTLVMSGLTWAHDDDDYYHQGASTQARQYGYDRGYNDGLKKGRHEAQKHNPFDYQTSDWRQATHGYRGWMGPVSWYQSGYQEGYREGFRSGFESVTPRWEDKGRYDHGRPPYYGWRGDNDHSWRGHDNIAYRIGYEDGSGVAWRDINKRNPYNPNPRGKFEDRDHGYRREYGSKDEYRIEYTRGYRAGYEAVMDRRYR